MTELFIAKAVKYAASKTSATTETATSPEMLADGAIGIYYFVPSTGKLALITAANTLSDITTATGQTSDKVKYFICMGSTTSSYSTVALQASFLDYFFGQEFTLPTKAQAYVGYDGVDTSKTFNLPTIAQYDYAAVQVITRRNQNNIEDDYTQYNATLNASDSAFTVASKMCQAANFPTPSGVVQRAVFEVVTNSFTAATVYAGTSLTFVKGSNVITTAGTSTIAAGDYLRITMNPLTNTIVTGTAPTPATAAVYYVSAVNGASVTLDRAWSGESQVITAYTGFVRGTTAPTSFGIRVVAANVNQVIDVSFDGVLANATRTNQAVGMATGSGTLAHVTSLEYVAQIEAGAKYTTDKVIPAPASRVNSAATGYDLYFMIFNPVIDINTVGSYKTTEKYGVTLVLLELQLQ
jgi:hypothetical protein